MTRALHLLILYALTHIPSRPPASRLLHIWGTHHPPHRRRLTINPVLATHIIRANLIGKLAVLHSRPPRKTVRLGVVTIVLSSIALFAKKLWAHSSPAPTPQFRMRTHRFQHVSKGFC